MDAPEVLADAFGRVAEEVRAVLDGIDASELGAQLDEEANPIGWIVWHLTRVQDRQVAAAFGAEEVWTKQGWAGRFGLPFPPTETGYGHGPGEVASFRAPSVEDLLGYYEAVHAQTLGLLGQVQEEDLDRVVDESWDPPVTLGVRLVSIVADDLQHVGQAAYLRGVLRRKASRSGA